MSGAATGMVVPVTRSWAKWSALGTVGFHYAHSFSRKAKIGSGQDVLVNGATGAIGSAAVQLPKSLGVNLTAVCGTDSWRS
jgi:NADPH:quinone reductase-like Zn-dependent oxidoreductase